MKKIILSTIMMFILRSFEMQAQQVNQQIISSKHGLIIYPSTINSTQISIYPNPTASTIKIKSIKAFAGFDLEVFNERGNIFLQQADFNGEAIDVSSLRDGIYMVRLTNGRQRYVSKFVIQRGAK